MNRLAAFISRNSNGIGTGLTVLFISALLVVLWPQLRGRVSVKELAQNSEKYRGWTMTIEGEAHGLRPYPFSIGDNVDNHVLTLVDGDASVSMIYDRNRLSFDLKPGDPVVVTCAFVDYNENEILRAIKIRPGRR